MKIDTAFDWDAAKEKWRSVKKKHEEEAEIMARIEDEQEAKRNADSQSASPLGKPIRLKLDRQGTPLASARRLTSHLLGRIFLFMIIHATLAYQTVYRFRQKEYCMP